MKQLWAKPIFRWFVYQTFALSIFVPLAYWQFRENNIPHWLGAIICLLVIVLPTAEVWLEMRAPWIRENKGGGIPKDIWRIALVRFFVLSLPSVACLIAAMNERGDDKRTNLLIASAVLFGFAILWVWRRKWIHGLAKVIDVTNRAADD